MWYHLTVSGLTSTYILTSYSVTIGAARQLISAKGLYINNRPVVDIQQALIPSDFIQKRFIVLRAGKQKQIVVALNWTRRKFIEISYIGNACLASPDTFEFKSNCIGWSYFNQCEWRYTVCELPNKSPGSRLFLIEMSEKIHWAWNDKTHQSQGSQEVREEGDIPCTK